METCSGIPLYEKPTQGRFASHDLVVEGGELTKTLLGASRTQA